MLLLTFPNNALSFSSNKSISFFLVYVKSEIVTDVVTKSFNLFSKNQGHAFQLIRREWIKEKIGFFIMLFSKIIIIDTKGRPKFKVFRHKKKKERIL